METEWEGQWVELGLALEECRIDPPRDILPCDAGQLWLHPTQIHMDCSLH